MTESKILVIDDEKGIREILKLVLESYFDRKIVSAISGNDGIRILKEDTDFGVILCDYRMNDGDGVDVFAYVKENLSHIPFCLISTYEPENCPGMEGFSAAHRLNNYISKPFSSDDVVRVVSHALSGANCQEEYFPVQSEKFSKLTPDLVLNIYMKLSNEKYVCIVKNDTGAEFASTVQKYIDKGVDEFFLDGRSYQEFLDAAIHNIFSGLDEINDQSSEEEAIDLYFDSLDSISGFVRESGVHGEVVRIVEKAVDTALKVLSRHKDLGVLLKILNQKKGFIKSHAYLSSYISCSLANTMGLNVGDVMSKFVTAALFQDIALTDDYLATIWDLDSEEFRNLGPQEQDLVRGHPIMGSEKLAGNIPFLEDAAQMIKGHHELPEGKGFPHGLMSHQVKLIEALFIVSVNFSHILLTSPKEEVKGKVDQFRKTFSAGGSYKKCFESLRKTFKKFQFD